MAPDKSSCQVALAAADAVNRHQELPWLGDAMPKWMHRRDLEDIRWNMGLCFQRTAHYPQDPYVYDLCDRLGFILMEEVPNIKDLAFGRDVQRQNVKEMIRRDRNHPSIFIWSMGNETNQPADSAWASEEDKSRIIYLRRGENGGDYVRMTDKDLAIENLLRCTVRGWYITDDHDFGSQTGNPDGAQVTGTEAWQHFKCAATWSRTTSTSTYVPSTTNRKANENSTPAAGDPSHARGGRFCARIQRQDL